MRTQPRATLTLLAGIALLAACTQEIEGHTCDMANVGEVLSGTWSLHATGERTGCRNRRLEGELELDLAVPLEVTSTAVATPGRPTGEEPENEADAFVERIRRADFEVAADDMPSELALSGSTVGSCATLVLTERLANGDRLSYTLEGYIVSPSEVVGTFRGEGPEDCRVRGSFELTIR
jgi:hypothetical protein